MKARKLALYSIIATLLMSGIAPFARAARHFAQKRHMIFVQFFVLTFRVGSAIIQLSNEREEIRNSWTSM